MRALQLDAGGLRFVSDHAPPQPTVDESLIRVVRAGLCETDLQLVRGYMGFQGVLGHEFVGVAETGPFAGQRVVGEINCSCHRCETCLADAPNHCPHRTVLGILGRDGAFADYVRLPDRNLHRVPDSVSDDEAVFVEPLAAAFRILEQVEVAGKRVLVLGDGRLGQLCAQVLRRETTRLTLVGKHASKLKLARDCGVEMQLRNDMPDGRDADVIVDCTGSPSGITDAFRWLKPRGTLVLKTTVAGTPSLSLAPIVIDEFHVIGSRCGPFAPAIRALERKEIAVRPMIQARYPLDQAAEGFALVEKQPVLKVLFDIA
ncbi:MAG TPA: alcohol dehydrogenase catalytic domain-containing protein [Planctomycetaceae bacterium]|nr:alcohol dehydrogenase catalytic domain-containing protein [Planctomycetaceae bacterium]